jgi:hypothetical protein
MAINPDYDEAEIIKTVALAIKTFYEKLTNKLDDLTIEKLMKKNPYLYRAKAINSATSLIEAILTAHISSSEETIFGQEFFEPIVKTATGGQKAMAPGADVIIEKVDQIYMIAVKSGKGIFNSNAQKTQQNHFIDAGFRAKQAKAMLHAIVGYCYGRLQTGKHRKPRPYSELAGQKFWTFLTGNNEFYLKMLDYMGSHPEEFKSNFDSAYERAKNRLVRDFTNMFCQTDGSIDWRKMVEFNSKEEKPKKPKKCPSPLAI